MKGIGKEKIRATVEQLVTMDSQLHSTIFDFLYERDGKPPVCTPESVIRYLQFFIDLPEIRSLFAGRTLNELKEFFKEMIYKIRLKF